MRVAVILGTRPEAIKLVPLVRTVRQRGWDTRVWWTGQHDEMVSDVLELFDVEEDVKLDALHSCTSVSQVFGYVIGHVDALLDDWRPDLVWVQGDTTTAAAGALAAFHRQCRVGHIEAGLRTYDLAAPFPEEANRQIVTRIADLHYAPTERARDALLLERVPEASIRVTGNTGIDALMMGVELSRRALPAGRALLDALQAQAHLPRAALPNGRIHLVTTHRRENHGAPLLSILEAIQTFALAQPDDVLVYPVHPNPVVLEPVLSKLAEVPNVLLTRPLVYSELCAVMAACSLVITDSGGLQEEAVSLGLPVVVLRETTERPEGVDAGRAIVAGHDPKRILAAVDHMLRAGRREPVLVYGDGHACERIVEFTEAALG